MLSKFDIIDSHHHIGTKRTAIGDWEFSGRDLVQRMDKCRIEKVLAIHFVSALRAVEDFVGANNYVAGAAKQFPDRLAGAAIVNPLFGDVAFQEIERCHRLGFKAIKLHPIFHGYYHVDIAADGVVRLAGDLGIPVLIHSDFSTSVCTPYQIARLAARFPETTFVLLHFGLQPEMCKHVPGIVQDLDNLLLDTSQTPDSPYDVYVRPVRELGASRILFGSDGPECDVSVNLRKIEVAIEEYGLSREEAVQILSENARRVFNLGDARVSGTNS